MPACQCTLKTYAKRDGHDQMLGIGALGQFPLGGFPDNTLRLTLDILQGVVTEFVEKRLLTLRPPELHHFTSLDAAYRIIDGDDVFLLHAEYSNDQNEMEEAKEIIRRELDTRSLIDPFFAHIFTDYQNLAPALDAYIFCTSTGRSTGGPSPQDMLKSVACLRAGWQRHLFDTGRRPFATPGTKYS